MVLWPHRAREAVAGKGVRGEVAPGPRARGRKDRWTGRHKSQVRVVGGSRRNHGAPGDMLGRD